ncbi:MAG: magnesium transporter CorA family protein [Bacillus subtilis]|nr:magnesium transporter CorA family protein [Bacillus subtilis]
MVFLIRRRGIIKKAERRKEEITMINVYLTTEAGELQVWKSGVDADVVKSIVPRAWVYLVEPTEEEIVTVARCDQDRRVDPPQSTRRRGIRAHRRGGRRHHRGRRHADLRRRSRPSAHQPLLYDADEHPLQRRVFRRRLRQEELRDPRLPREDDEELLDRQAFQTDDPALYRNASMFVTLLKQLDKESEGVQAKLQEALKNSELFDLMNLNKSLVYLSTGLNADLIVLERLKNQEAFRQFPDDVALIDDAIIENRQAIEMSTIHREILGGTLDTYASVISNNVNAVMKTLTVVTIVLTVPMMIASFFGMNFTMPVHVDRGFWFAFILSIALSVMLAVFLANYSSKLNYHWGQKRGPSALPRRKPKKK